MKQENNGPEMGLDPIANGHDVEVLGGELEWSEDVPNPPTANYVTNRAAFLLKGLTQGKITYQVAMGGAKLVDSVAKVHSNKLRAAMYQSKPLHKDLLKELSVKI